jgi:hypothetical protein
MNTVGFVLFSSNEEISSWNFVADLQFQQFGTANHETADFER